MSSSPISSSSPSSLWRTPFNTKSSGACMASSLQMWFDSTLIWIWIIDRLDRTLGSWKKGNGSVEKITTHESCQEQDQYHWVLFTNCPLGECCNGAANRWCAQTILQFHFLRQFPYQVMCLAVLLCWRWRSQACSMAPANLNSLSRHFLCAKGFHQFPTVFSRLACQNEKIDLETKQISRCIYNIF